MSAFEREFNDNEQELFSFARELQAYNKELEPVFIAMIKEIKERSLGKRCDKKFADRVMAALPQGVWSISAGVNMNGYKYVTIFRIGDNGIQYRFNEKLRHTLTNGATFYCNDAYRPNSCDYDGKFLEGAITELENTITNNRKRVAYYQDAVKNFKRHLAKAKKTMSDFIKTMETINPLFVEWGMINNMSYYRDIPRYNYQAYEDKMYKGVEPYKYES